MKMIIEFGEPPVEVIHDRTIVSSGRTMLAVYHDGGDDEPYRISHASNGSNVPGLTGGYATVWVAIDAATKWVKRQELESQAIAEIKRQFRDS